MKAVARSLHEQFVKFNDDLVMRHCRRWLQDITDPKTLVLKRRIFNVAVVSNERYFFKLGYREPNSVRNEYERVTSLRSGFPTLARFLPDLDLLELPGARPCLRLPRLQAMEPVACVEAAQEVLSKFWEKGEYAVGLLRDLPSAKRGVEIVAQVLPERAAAIHAAATWAMSQPMHWGPAHGDFHCGNLLVGANGRVQLIDFDCLQTYAPQEFDWLYFNIEFAAARQELQWIRLLERDFGVPVPDPLGAATRGVDLHRPRVLLLYVLDRIGQEERFGIHVDKPTVARFAAKALAATPVTWCE